MPMRERVRENVMSEFSVWCTCALHRHNKLFVVVHLKIIATLVALVPSILFVLIRIRIGLTLVTK